MISTDTIDEIKARMDIIEVVGDFVKLKRQGSNHIGLCPFHNEKSGSFTVSPSKQIYKCFGCGKSGDAIEFLNQHERKTYPEALEYLAKKYNIAFDHDNGKREFVPPPARKGQPKPATVKWFEEKRKITRETLYWMQITESVEFFPQHNAEKPAICFNYYRNGELVNIKFRGPDKAFRLSKDAERIFYNLDRLEGEETGIIVEGEIDVLTLMQCKITNCVSVPNGASKGIQNLEYLDNCWEVFAKLNKVIIAVDDDECGRLLKEELGRRIGKEKCQVVTYPAGCKDANEILIKLGDQAVIDWIATAKNWPIEGIIEMEDMFETLVDYYENGYPPGAPSGVEGLDKFLTFYPGHLTTWTGIPGHGKDEATNEVMVKLALNQDWKWGVFNFEEPAEIHATKLMEKFKGKAFAYRKDPNYRMSKKDFEHGVYLVEKHFHFVNVSKVDVTMEGICKKIEELVARFGINGVILNPWNYLEHRLKPGQTETHYVSEALTLLCNCLWKTGVHGFLIAHPTKMQKDKKTGKYEIPTLYHVNGSSHFYNKTHNGVCAYRDFNSGLTEWHIQKVKWYWIGQVGWVAYRFNTLDRQYTLVDTSLRMQAEAEAPPGLTKLAAGTIDHTEANKTTLFETTDDELAEQLDDSDEMPF